MPVFAPRFTITNAVAAGLTVIERARGFLDAATLSDAWIARMSQRALLLEAHHTTHIEGTQLTLEESARLWAGETVEGANREDVRELLNSRTREVTYTPPPPAEVAPLMRDMVEWLRADTDIHPVLVAGIAQFQLVHIHPFVDGNGRASRLLSTLCLYRTGYDFKRLFTLSEFYDRDRGAFYAALRTVRASDMDLTGWLEFFVLGLKQQMEEVKSRGTAVIRADLQARLHRLGSRQSAVLAAVYEAGTLSLGELQPRFLDVSRRSLQRDLRLLLEKGLIREVGSAALTDPNRSYGPAPDGASRG